MDRFGFIREKLDIKILILFVLRRLPGPVDFHTLLELAFIDGGIDYFDYTQCLPELIDTGHIRLIEEGYEITELGDQHCLAVESSLPYSVRVKAENKAAPLIRKMKRDMLIGTSHEILPKGGCMVKLSLSDGVGDILNLSILASDEEQALDIEKFFRSDAEGVYHKIIELLSPEDKH